ncbi:MAG: DUF2975 domain-containing protein [Clostridiaceae bacterium]|nr:DUF2975 domain-containing protein [Clostridiaceae bacterium]
MGQLKNNHLALVLRIIADILIASGFLSLFFIPSVIRSFYDILYDSGARTENIRTPFEPYDFAVAFVYVCAVLFIGILIAGHFILRTLEKGNPFDARNSRRFTIVGLISLLLTIVFVAKIFMYNTLLTMLAAALFPLIGLVAFVLAEVFKQASDLWHEHQLTV